MGWVVAPSSQRDLVYFSGWHITSYYLPTFHKNSRFFFPSGKKTKHFGFNIEGTSFYTFYLLLFSEFTYLLGGSINLSVCTLSLDFNFKFIF